MLAVLFPAPWSTDDVHLVMFLTNQYSIKEVLTFPFMKDDQAPERKLAAEVVDVQPIVQEGIRKFSSEPLLVVLG